MSRVASEIIRVQDRLLLKLSIRLERECAEWSYIEFRSGDSVLDIFSTTEGAIQGNRIIIRKQKPYLETCLDYISSDFDCVIAYLDGDNLMKHETIHIEPERVKVIEGIEERSESVATENKDFAGGLRELHDALALRRSAWHLKMELDKDIKVAVLRCGKVPISVVFGEFSDGLVDGDFIFTLDPLIKSFVVPTELVWRNYRKYKKQARIAVFELVQADFHRIPNIFYKSPISNSVAVSAFPKIKPVNSESFTSPLGVPLSQDKWQCEYGLPTWRSNG